MFEIAHREMLADRGAGPPWVGNRRKRHGQIRAFALGLRFGFWSDPNFRFWRIGDSAKRPWMAQRVERRIAMLET